MKKYLSIILSVIIFLFISKVKAISITPNEVPYKYLNASKGTKTKRYKLNTSVAIIFKSSLDKKRKVKGTLINILNDSVSILSFKRKIGIIKIAIKDIETVYKLHKKGREGHIFFM